MSVKALGRTRFTEKNITQAISFLTKKSPNAPHYLRKFEGFHQKQGKLLYFDREVVPPSKITATIRELFNDESIPAGMKKLERYITDRYIGIPVRKVREFIRTQDVYQMKKQVPLPVKTRSFLHETVPFKTIEIDCTFSAEDTKHANNNSNIIIAAVDRHTRYAWAKILQRQTAAQVVPFLDQINKDVQKFGFKMKVLYSDNGTELKNELVTKWCKLNKVKQQFTKPYSPAKYIENWNGSFRRARTKFMQKFKTKRFRDWIPQYMKRYNSSQHSTTKLSPNQMIGLEPDTRHLVSQRIFRKKKKGVTPSRQPALKAGDKVRKSLLKRDKESGKIGHIDTREPNWTETVYEVDRIVQTRGQQKIFLKGLVRFVYRTELQKVHGYDTTSKMTYKDRPAYKFDRPDTERMLKQPKPRKPRQPAPALPPQETFNTFN